jgi:cysteine desulfurase
MFYVALGKACEISTEALKSIEIKQLTAYFYNRLKEIFADKIHLNGHPDKRLPNTLNVSFIGYNGHEVLNSLHEVAASTGSACHSGSTSISPVLAAMGVSDDIGRGAVRFSLGRYTTKEEIDAVLEKIQKIMTI